VSILPAELPEVFPVRDTERIQPEGFFAK
jgi:hypothetical protein